MNSTFQFIVNAHTHRALAAISIDHIWCVLLDNLSPDYRLNRPSTCMYLCDFLTHNQSIMKIYLRFFFRLFGYGLKIHVTRVYFFRFNPKWVRNKIYQHISIKWLNIVCCFGMGDFQIFCVWTEMNWRSGVNQCFKRQKCREKNFFQ